MPKSNDIALLKIEHLKEVTELKFALNEKALQLQRVENDRRLLDLNGETGRIKDIVAQTVPRELYVSEMASLVNRVEANSRFVNFAIGGLVVLQIVFRYFLN